MIRVAVDTGGTFTDVVAHHEGQIYVAKVTSRPKAPDQAVAEGLRVIAKKIDAGSIFDLTHGTTVATNSLLENDGAQTWFITNKGYEDLLAIGRQDRPELYNWHPSVRPRLVPRTQTIGVAGRRAMNGSVLEELDTKDLQASLRALPQDSEGNRSWAICLLHSYANGDDERTIAACIRKVYPGEPISMSHEVMPEFREVERAGTTIANAHVAPLMSKYLARIEQLADRVDIMGSSGGRHAVSYAVEFPVCTALSGPAGGVVAAMDEARRFELPGVLSVDMGGTSTDVALCRGELPVRYDGKVGAFPIHVPMLDIHTVGAGGGSLAYVDEGGALRVGPRSAGAEPGPACYGVGERATVTDANVVLERIPHDTKLAGVMDLYPERSQRAVADIAEQLGVSTRQAAEGMINIAIETMAGAVRSVSVERGVDPREFPLCALGGAGALHACELAERLNVSRVIVPGDAGTLSARGMLLSRQKVTRSATVLGQSPEARDRLWDELLHECSATLGGSTMEGSMEVRGWVDLRYEGQSFELTVPCEPHHSDGLQSVFEAKYKERFGYQLDHDIEVVTLRVEATNVGSRQLPSGVGRSNKVTGRVAGPEVIQRVSSTVYIPDTWSGYEYEDGTLLLEYMRAER